MADHPHILDEDVIDLRNSRSVGGGSRVAKGARVGGRAVPIISGAITVGSILWWGYTKFNPPPDWDFAEGEDPVLGVEETGLHILDGPCGSGDLEGAWSGPHLATEGDAEASGVVEGAYYIGVSPTLAESSPWGFRTHDEYPVGSYEGCPDVWGFSGGATGHQGTVGDERWFRIMLHDSHRVMSVRMGNSSGFVTLQYYQGTMEVQGRIAVEYGCYDEVADFESHHKETTDWYAHHDDRPPIPEVECLGTNDPVISYVDVYRETTQGDRRYLVGGPHAETQPADGVEIFQPGSTDPTTNIRLTPMPTPSGLTSGEENIWETCVEDGTCIFRGVRTEDDTTITPGRDAGWWFGDQVEQDYECHVISPNGDTLVLPMDYCAHERWVEGPDGDLYLNDEIADDPVDDPNTEPDPDEETYPEPDLSNPAPDTPAIPSDGPIARQDCMASYEDSGGFTSWIVFRGTACALQWAFLPSETFMLQLTEQHSQATSGRLPFALQPVFTEHIPEIVPMPGQATCNVNIWEFPPQQHTPDGFPQLAIPCEPPWNHTVPYALMSTGVILMVLRGIWNMLSKPLGAPQDGFADNTLGGQLS